MNFSVKLILLIASIGIVMLANRNYLNPARIQAAHKILEQLAR